MNINNLKENMVIKNYKELCNLLEIQPKTSNSKKAQLKDLERFIKYHKEGQKIIIDKIYDKPKAKAISENSKYIREIEYILVDFLYNKCKTKGYNVALSFGEFIKMLGIVNNTYEIGNRHKKELCEILNVNIMGVYYFYDNTRNEFKKILERVLNNLQKRRVLNWHIAIKICKKKIGYDEETKLEYTYNDYVLATHEEEQEIINIENQVLRELGATNGRDIFLKKLGNKYQRRIKELLPDNWIYYFYCYDLTIGDIALNLELKDLKKERLSLNSKMKDRAEKRLKIKDNNEDEKLLIDALIDLLKYDFNLDFKILKKHKENIKNKNNDLEEKYKKLSNLEYKKEELLKEINMLEESELDIHEYIEYSKNKRNINNDEYSSNIDDVIKEMEEIFKL